MARIPDTEKRCGSTVELYLGPDGRAATGVIRAVAAARRGAHSDVLVNAEVMHVACDRHRHDGDEHGVELDLRGNRDDVLYCVSLQWRAVSAPGGDRQ